MRLLYIIPHNKIIPRGAAVDRTGILFAPQKDDNIYFAYQIYGITH
jgi:hypothetical protein